MNQSCKMQLLSLLFFLCFTLSAHSAGIYQVVTPPPLRLDTIAIGLNEPGNVATAFGDSSRMFVTERLGKIRVVRNDTLLASPFLDITSKIQTYATSSEGPTPFRNGLMDIAFPPEYQDSGYFFVMYLAAPDTALTIERFRVTSQPDSADPSSGVVVFQQPLSGRTGQTPNRTDECSMIFGADSLLYIALADYSSDAGSVYFADQGATTMFGHFLRIDVRSLPYTIPAQNPFASNPDTLPEILSMVPISACRSMSLDSQTGDILFTSDQPFQWWSPTVYHLLPAGSANVLTAFVALNDVQWPSSPSAGAVIYRGELIPILHGRIAHAQQQLVIADSIPAVFNDFGAITGIGTFFSIRTSESPKKYSEHTIPVGALFNDPKGEIITLVQSTLSRIVPAICCTGTRGNVDCSLDDGVDIADLTLFVDHLFGSFPPLCCPDEGNVDGVGGIDIGDLTRLVDHLFISFQPTASCP